MIEIYYTEDRKEIVSSDFTKKYDKNTTFETMIKTINPKEQVIVYINKDDLLKIRIKVGKNDNFTYQIYKEQQNNLDEATIYSDLEKLWKNEIKYVVYKPKNKILGEKVYITANNVKLNVKDLVVPVKDIKSLWENPQKYMIKSVFNGMELAEWPYQHKR